MDFENLHTIRQSVLQLLEQLELLKLNSDFKYYNITNVQSLFLSQFIKLKIASSIQDSNKNFKILEFGTSNGYSFLSILLGIIEFNYTKSRSIEHLQHYSLIGFEIDENRYNQARKNISKYLGVLDNLEVFQEDIFNSHNKVKELNLDLFDIIFVDCNQEFYEEVVRYILEHNLLSNSGSILFENTLSHKKSFNFLNLFSEYEFEIVEFPLHNGFIELKLIEKVDSK